MSQNLYQAQIAKFDNCAIATPPTKFGVVSYANITDTKAKVQSRNPRVNAIHNISNDLISFAAPRMRQTLTRAYL